MWSRLESNNKRLGSGLRQKQLRLFGQLSVVNDLQIIRSKCSACGNTLHVVTAWKKTVCYGLRAGRGISLCSTLMGRDPLLHPVCF